jgi:hypothetical protein
MKLPTDQTVFQNAWVVDDFEIAAMKWVDIFNIGPFFLGEYGAGEIVDVSYRGQPAEMTMLVGIAQAGPIQIELIQPMMDGPNCYRDTVKPGENKFHHVCVWTDDLEADLKHYNDKGCVTANKGTVKAMDVGFAYVDTQAELGCMMEMLERNEAVNEIFKMVAAAGTNWDGKDPIRSYG